MNLKAIIFSLQLLSFTFYGDVLAYNVVFPHHESVISYTKKLVTTVDDEISIGAVPKKEVNIITNKSVVPKEYEAYVVFTNLDSDREALTKQWIQKVLEKYPRSLINDNVANIYISNEIHVYDAKYGGTYIGNNIYLTNQNYYTFTDFEKLFHAEFSSILLNNYREHFQEEKWLSFNPVGFQYSDDNGYNYLLTLKDGKYDSSRDKFYIEKGLLTEYAATNLENDFNAIVRAMFSGDKNLWNNVDNNKALNGKLELAIQFYHSLNPMFTRAYFESL